jgi:hypothetical protein
MPDPKTVNRKDYVFCEGCDGYVLKKLVLTKSGGFFSDEPDGPECPAGHPVKLDEPPAGG